MAETYNIYDYRSIPVNLLATLSVGLRDNARIKMKLRGEQVSMDTFLLCSIVDQLSVMLWCQSKDGLKGINRPKSILNILLGKTKASEIQGFISSDEFELARKRILGG